MTSWKGVRATACGGTPTDHRRDRRLAGAWRHAPRGREGHQGSRSLTTASPLYRLKLRARMAIPFGSGARTGMDQRRALAPPNFVGTLAYGSTVTARNTIYSSAVRQLPPERGRYWFEVAAMVTGRGAIKDLEIPVVKVAGSALNFPGADAIAFVLAGNTYLYPYNLHNFYTLRTGGWVPEFESFRRAIARSGPRRARADAGAVIHGFLCVAKPRRKDRFAGTAEQWIRVLARQ